jgi:hypothetical protein
MASQKSPYLFFYARAYEDVKLVMAGWEATLLWPHVLALLKQRVGVMDNDECSPAFVAATLRCPMEIAEAGLAGLKRVGLLVEGSRSCPGGAGGSHERVGWVTPSWDKWAVDPREKGQGREKTTVRAPSATVPAPLPDRSGAFQTVTQDNGELERELERENNPPTPRKRGASRRATHDESPEALEVYAFWKALQAERGTIRTGKAFPAAWQVQARINEFGVPTVKAVVEWAHKADHKLAANLREGDYLTDTLFRPGNFPKYEGPALAWKAGTPTQDKEAWLKDWRETLDTFDSACRLNGFTASREGFLAFLGAHRRAALPVPESVLDLVDRRIARSA